MIFHYRAGGDFAENGVPAERMAEIDTRYADALLGLLLQRGDPALDRDRPPSERAVGCCRDATVLFLALARAKGMQARIPPVVTSIDPNGGPSRPVDVSRALSLAAPGYQLGLSALRHQG